MGVGHFSCKGAGQSSFKCAAAAAEAEAAISTDELILRVDLEPDRLFLDNNLLSFSSDTFIRRGLGVLKMVRFSVN